MQIPGMSGNSDVFDIWCVDNGLSARWCVEQGMDIFVRQAQVHFAIMSALGVIGVLFLLVVWARWSTIMTRCKNYTTLSSVATVFLLVVLSLGSVVAAVNAVRGLEYFANPMYYAIKHIPDPFPQ